jgi:hypothetical protein
LFKQLFLNFKSFFMGRIIKRSKLGEIAGKVGDLVLSTWNGIEYVKSTPRRSNKKATQSQQEQRLKMTIAGQFLSELTEVVMLGFRGNAYQMSGFNVASSRLMKDAIEGQYPDFTINYSQVELSQGRLSDLFVPKATATVKETITFTWETRELPKASPTDKAILVAYAPEFNTGAYTLSGPERTQGTGTLVVPGLSGADVHTWVFFISADGKKLSDSLYAGKVTLV